MTNNSRNPVPNIPGDAHDAADEIRANISDGVEIIRGVIYLNHSGNQIAFRNYAEAWAFGNALKAQAFRLKLMED